MSSSGEKPDNGCLGSLYAETLADKQRCGQPVPVKAFSLAQSRLRNRCGANMRSIVLLAALTVPVVEVLASEFETPQLFLYEQGTTFEQILAGTSGTADLGRSWDLHTPNDVDSIVLRGRTVRAPAFAEDLQALIALVQTKRRPIEVAPAGSDDNLLTAASGNLAAIDASLNGISTKGDLASISETKNAPSSDFGHSGSFGLDEKSDLASSAVRPETMGFAAVLLLLLWFAVTVVAIAVHAEQKADRRRDLAALHGVLGRSSLLAPKLVHPKERALQARPDALSAYETQLMNGTANANVRQGAVYAA
jgi:hypothetical protein